MSSPQQPLRRQAELAASRERKPPVVQRFFRRATFLAVLLLSAVTGSLTGLTVAYQSGLTSDAKQVSELANFQPSGVTQVLADDGKTVIGEFALERRIPLSYDEIPVRMRHAILAIEDARFEKHWGVDPIGITRALVKNLAAGRTVEGGSTLTQQLTKMLFLSPEQTLTRKAKEALLALQIERQFSKQQIFELYANQINLGGGAYGVEAGAQYYFGKSCKELSIEECATLAAIPKAPTSYSPKLNPEKALQRRNLVITNMIEEGFITKAEGEAAKKTKIKLNIAIRDGNNSGPYAYFVEEVRRYLEEKYDTKQTHTGSLKVFTTLDAKAQIQGVNATRLGLHQYDRRHSKWRGNLPNILNDGYKDIAKFKHPDWELSFFNGMYLRGLITEVGSQKAKVSFGKYHATVGSKEIAIAGGSPESVFKVGDVAIFRITKIVEETKPETASDKDKKAKEGDGKDKKKKESKAKPEPVGDPFELGVELEQQPLVAGAFLTLDAHTGEIKVLVGGYDFAYSKFNNAVQGNRQTGSTFKPFIYTAALENGWKPEDTVLDAPFTAGNWSPHNYDNSFMGAIPLRTALAQSRNIPAVRLLASVGIKKGAEMVKRFGITNPMAPFLPSALGATEVPLIELVSGYSVFPNQGQRAKPHFIRRIEDRNGRTLYDYDREEGSKTFPVVSPYVAANMVSLMRGVVESGTAARIKSITEADLNKREIAGKTGTVNDFTDAWFIGYTPSVVSGCWIGYQGDKRSLGDKETGGTAALPMWIKFMGYYMKGRPIEKFPEGPGADEKMKQMQAERTKEAQKALEAGAVDMLPDTGSESAKQAIGKGDGKTPPKPGDDIGAPSEDGDVKKKPKKPDDIPD
ncbi:MAG: PBP1A family penicillin-binding protein [Blastocatellia bacterium]|nr:PBP1A family penicillin-binding protein [Blastocatellia bacterium]